MSTPWLKIASGAIDNNDLYAESGPGVAFAAGQALWHSCIYKADRVTGTNSLTFRISTRWFNSTGSLISATSDDIVIAGTVGETFVKFPVVAPANAAAAKVRFTATPAGGTMQHDLHFRSCRLTDFEPGATVGATWGTDVASRPIFLTDGRVGLALDSAGDLARDLVTTRLNTSNVLRFTGGSLFSGALNATFGAAWGTNLTGRPTELTDGRVVAGLLSTGDLARNLTTTRANTSNILRFTGGQLYTGELNASYGATLGVNAQGFGGLAAKTLVQLGAAGEVYREGGSVRVTDALAITSLGTASAITGQGALATKATADFATDVSGTTKPANNATVGADWASNISGRPGAIVNLRPDGRLNAENVQYLDQTTGSINDIKPQEAGANKTETRIAASITGQSNMATKNVNVLANGRLSAEAIGWLSDGISVDDYRPQDTNSNRTETRISSGFLGQGGLASKSAVDLATTEVSNKNLNNIADTTSYSRVATDELTGGVPKLSIAGSGKRVGDQRNLPPVNSMNLSYKWTGAITYTAQSNGTCTISVGAATVPIGSQNISYNAMSKGETGTAGQTSVYFLYVDDLTYSGGTKSLGSTTSSNAIYQNDGRIWIGSVTVQYPAAGSGSTSGGGSVGTGGGGSGGGPIP